MKESAINIVGYLPSQNGKLHHNSQIYCPYGGGIIGTLYAGMSKRLPKVIVHACDIKENCDSPTDKDNEK